jgi:DNA-directed RNA polymerase subunit M/transcription elongation factor TFIIS
MAVFKVHYSFTCQKCGKPESAWIEVQTSDELAAFTRAHGLIRCPDCTASLKPKQLLSTTMKRVG